MAVKESEERDSRMTREIERLLNDHDSTYAQTMTNLEKRLDAKADLMIRKLDELFSISNQENDFGPRGNSRQATDRFRVPRHAEVPPRLRTSFEPNHRERPRVHFNVWPIEQVS